MDKSESEPEPTAWQTLAPLIDLVTPMSVRAAATLGVADVLADGPLTVENIAERTDTNVEALYRLLQHLTVRGLFTEMSDGSFELTDTGSLLRSDHPAGMQPQLDLEGFGGQMDLAFTGLIHTVRTGEPAWETVFGAPFWEHLAVDAHMSASFDATMSADPAYVTDRVDGYDWSTAGHIVDVGGGTGRLLAAVLEAQPTSRGTLVDLPETAGRGGDYLRSRGLSDRTAIVGQSFFDPLPMGGDVYVLTNVLHDWNDDAALAILRTCADAAGARGRVLIIEGPGNPETGGADFTEMNLRMLVLAGGRQRGPREYRHLVELAGMAVTSTHETELGHTFIECSRERHAS